MNEEILEDDYPIYADYWYLVDGVPQRSDWHDITARDFRRLLGAKEIRRCNAVKRNLPLW